MVCGHASHANKLRPIHENPDAMPGWFHAMSFSACPPPPPPPPPPSPPSAAAAAAASTLFAKLVVPQVCLSYATSGHANDKILTSDVMTTCYTERRGTMPGHALCADYAAACK